MKTIVPANPVPVVTSLSWVVHVGQEYELELLSEALDRRDGDGLQPEKNPNGDAPTPPNARCGNRAVPPATGYVAPSSAWTSASSPR